MDEDVKTPMPMYEKTLAQVGAYNEAATKSLIPVGYRPTITEQLQMRRAQLLTELANVEAALQKAKEQEGAMGLLDAISRTDVGSRRDY